MWLQCQKERGTDCERNTLEQAWPCAETLASLAELNEECLELITGQALLRAEAAPPLLRELGELWSALEPGARRRAAGCPYLLLDAGFADPYRWRGIGGQVLADREPTPFGAFFTVPQLTRVSHQIFSNAWYLARTQPLGLPLYLGMPSSCVSLLRACTVRQIAELAERGAGWLRPRWEGSIRIWRELLQAAICGEGAALERARMHGVQLLASELKALELREARSPGQSKNM